ncbi:MAG: hypothetical protein AB7F31_07265 [Parachlamydiales bacterium]
MALLAAGLVAALVKGRKWLWLSATSLIPFGYLAHLLQGKKKLQRARNRANLECNKIFGDINTHLSKVQRKLAVRACQKFSESYPVLAERTVMYRRQRDLYEPSHFLLKRQHTETLENAWSIAQGESSLFEEVSPALQQIVKHPRSANPEVYQSACCLIEGRGRSFQSYNP